MRRHGLTLIEVVMLIVAAGALFFFLVIVPGDHEQLKRSSCSSNLRQLHTSMTLYAQDYEGVFPMVPLGKGQVVGEDNSTDNLKPAAREDAGQDFPANNNPSVSQNLWLLIRGDFAQPEIFTCPSSDMAGNKCNTRDIIGNKGGMGADYYVDFPWTMKGAVMSYSFVQPWSKFSKEHDSRDMWKEDVDPKFVLGADANNGSQPDYQKSKVPPLYSDMMKFVNSRNHTGDFQNVLYGDGHVTGEKSPYCGVGGDNIYTARSDNFTGTPDQTAGILSVRPQNPFGPKARKPPEWDTVLIPNKDADLKKWNRKP